MKNGKILRIQYVICFCLFCVLLIIFPGYNLLLKLLGIAILLLFPVGVSYLLSKLIKTPFVVLLKLANLFLVFFLICITIMGIGYVEQEKKYDAMEANLDYSKEPGIYFRAIAKKAAVYINTRYIDSEVVDLYSSTYPLIAGDSMSPKPEMIRDIAIYVNGNKKENLRSIRLQFDSTLAYKVIYDRKILNDSAERLKNTFDSVKSHLN